MKNYENLQSREMTSLGNCEFWKKKLEKFRNLVI
jgi:hypothetical protein